MKRAVARDPWASATWEGAARANLLAGARTSLAERLAWLEEAGAAARCLAESRARRTRARAADSRPGEPPASG
jgi:hypothetical protein